MRLRIARICLLAASACSLARAACCRVVCTPSTVLNYAGECLELQNTFTHMFVINPDIPRYESFVRMFNTQQKPRTLKLTVTGDLYEEVNGNATLRARKVTVEKINFDGQSFTFLKTNYDDVAPLETDYNHVLGTSGDTLYAWIAGANARSLPFKIQWQSHSVQRAAKNRNMFRTSGYAFVDNKVCALPKIVDSTGACAERPLTCTPPKIMNGAGDACIDPPSV